jgi:hypothetical protein
MGFERLEKTHSVAPFRGHSVREMKRFERFSPVFGIFFRVAVRNDMRKQAPFLNFFGSYKKGRKRRNGRLSGSGAMRFPGGDELAMGPLTALASTS